MQKVDVHLMARVESFSEAQFVADEKAHASNRRAEVTLKREVG